MTQGHGGTPAGWYPDPEGHGERWWNGMSWGELRVAPQPYSQSPPAPAQSYAQPAEPAPQQQTVRPDMHCVHCQWNDFQPADYLLINPRGTNPFNPDNFNFSANCLICRRCGFIHWFAAR